MSYASNYSIHFNPQIWPNLHGLKGVNIIKITKYYKYY